MYLECSQLEHLVEIVDPSRGLFGQSLDARQQLRILGVDEVREVAAVVQDHVERLTVWKVDGLLDAPEVFLVRLALPGVDGDTPGGHGGGGVVLGGEDVARRPTGPGHLFMLPEIRVNGK